MLEEIFLKDFLEMLSLGNKCLSLYSIVRLILPCWQSFPSSQRGWQGDRMSIKGSGFVSVSQASRLLQMKLMTLGNVYFTSS